MLEASISSCKMAVVLIPIYKRKINIHEKVALQQVRKILGGYKICFIAPVSLTIDYDGLEEGIEMIRFPDDFFLSTVTYSHLLLMPSFYRRFSNYCYMLIYQLDAFVFSDRLQEFCELNYDYIGGPWARVHRNTQTVKCSIGNGGFSLRKVSSHEMVCQRRDEILNRLPNKKKNLLMKCEDLFFAYCSTQPDLNFHVANFTKAIDFSVDEDVGHVFERMPRWMPFGCHAWSTGNYNFWRPLIENAGYSLPEGTSKNNYSSRLRRIGLYALKRVMKYDRYEEYLSILENINIDVSDKICIWGMGAYGKLCYNFFSKSGRIVEAVYDKSSEQVFTDKIKSTYSSIDVIIRNRYKIVIGTLDFQDDVACILEEIGYIRDRDYCSMSDIMNKAIKIVCHNMMGYK